MNKVFVLVLSICFAPLMFASEGQSPSAFSQLDRQVYIEQSLVALGKSKKRDIENLYKFLRIVRTNNCVPVVKQLGIQCMIETAKRNCANKGKKARDLCQRVSDVIIATLFEEPRIVDRRMKSKIAKATTGSIREAVYEEMKRHYAILSLDLMADPGWECNAQDLKCLSRGIHRYCEKYSDSKSGSWQGCASGLVWYIGLNRNERS
ncbi:MAG: hypothetical protein H6624_08055 [Bdellovibrionaceae bacterium]|nr:hypothetical protein [Bdellovibrionales bacterium]MCB9084285.1 hypothetical protein [Pseudobdellovibrionaceae bacterium]